MALIVGAPAVVLADTEVYTAAPTASGYSSPIAYPPDSQTYCVAYPFTPTGSGGLTKIQAWLAANTTPNFQAEAEILSDNSNSPHTLLETSSNSINYPGLAVGSSVGYNSASFTLSTFTFSGSTNLTSGTQYWAVFTWAGSSPSGGDDYLLGQSNSSITNGWRGSSPCGTSSWSEPNTQTAVAMNVYVSNAVAAPTTFHRIFGWW